MNKARIFTSLAAIAICCFVLQATAEADVAQNEREKREVSWGGDNLLADMATGVDAKPADEDTFPIIDNGATGLTEDEEDDDDEAERAAGGKKKKKGNKKRKNNKKKGGNKKKKGGKKGGKKKNNKKRKNNKRKGGKRKN